MKELDIAPLVERLEADSEKMRRRNDRRFEAAKAALQGLLAGQLLLKPDGEMKFMTKAEVCGFAISYADALLLELDRKEGV